MTVTAARSRPKMRAISGVMAMIGIDRIATATGVTTQLTVDQATAAAETRTAATRPIVKPTAVSTIVVQNADHIADRSSLVEVRKRQTSPGRLAKYGLRSY